MVNVSGVQTVEVGYRNDVRSKVPKESLMLTDDENIVDLQFAVQYVLKDPTEYLFNKQAIRHQFCTTCGIESFAYATSPDGTPTVAVNLNCLDGVDAHAMALKAHVYDGASK